MSPELRFAHWLRGYLDAHLARSLTPLDPLPASDVLHIRQALQFATGDMVQLGRDPLARNDQVYKLVNEQEMIGQVYGSGAPTRAQDIFDRSQADAKELQRVMACRGQTIPLQEQQRVEREQRAGVDKSLHEQLQANALQQRRDPDCPAHDTRCNAQECAVQNLGGGYGIPRGVR
jgi:hypothetical protein